MRERGAPRAWTPTALEAAYILWHQAGGLDDFCNGLAVCPLHHKIFDKGALTICRWFGTACELHRDWRNDIDGLGKLFANHLPSYKNLITSYLAHTASK